MQRRRVGILVFDDVEVLDFCGPFEVLSVTRLDESRRREDPSPFEVLLVAEREGIVTASGGLKVTTDYTIERCPPLDVLVVPGGWGTRREIHNAALLDWIRARGRSVDLLTSVCTGASLVGHAGVDEERQAAHHLQWLV